MSFELDLTRSRWSGTRDWWRGMPLWSKLVFLFVIVPAWLVIVFCVVTEQGSSTAALVAFGICVVATLLSIVLERLRKV